MPIIAAKPAVMPEEDRLFDLDMQVVASSHANEVYGVTDVHTTSKPIEG